MLDELRRLSPQVKNAKQIGHQPVAVHPQKGVHRAKHDQVSKKKEVDQNRRAIDEEQTEHQELEDGLKIDAGHVDHRPAVARQLPGFGDVRVKNGVVEVHSEADL